MSVGLPIFCAPVYVLRVDWGACCVLRVLGGTIGGANLYYLMLVHVADIGSYL